MMEQDKAGAEIVEGESKMNVLSREQIEELVNEKADHAKTVVVFIHGIGVQDRFQQLVSFTQGLRYTPKAGEFWVSKRGTDDTPQGQNVPLRIIPRQAANGATSRKYVDVDVCEVYWAPLLNGLTTWSAVLRWLALTLKEVPKIFLTRWTYPQNPQYLHDANSQVNEAKKIIDNIPSAAPDDLKKHLTQVDDCLAEAQAQITKIQSNLSTQKDYRFRIKVELSAAKDFISEAKDEISTAKKICVSDKIKDDLDEAKKALSAAKKALSFAKNPLPTAKTSLGKWMWQIGYFTLAFFVAFALMWTAFGSLLLTTDQLANPKQTLITSRLFSLQDDFKERSTKPSDFRLNLDSLRQGSSYVFYRKDQPAGVVEGLDVNPSKLLKQIEIKYLVYGLIFVVALFWLLVSIAAILQLAYNLSKNNKRKKRFRQSQHDEVERAIDRCNKETRHLLFSGLLRAIEGGTALFVLCLFDSVSKPIIVLVLIPLTIFLVLRKALYAGLSDVLGDVEIYVTRNENNTKYKGREAVLESALTTIKKVLDNPNYENVYIAGHSLGSVVGLDALRRLYTDYMLHYDDVDTTKCERYKKIKGFITFGSPLEKTLLFFHRDDYRSEFLEFNQTIDQRLFDLTPADKTPLPDRHCIHWFNFWIASDIVCDPLGSYPITPHHEVKLPGHVNFWSHSDYWTDPLFVRNILHILVWSDPKELNKLELIQPKTRRKK